jgi:predicted GTPase
VQGYIKNISMGLDHKSLSELLPKCKDQRLIFLLEQLLVLNPYERWSAAEALKSPIFDEIRNKTAEKSSKQKI